MAKRAFLFGLYAIALALGYFAVEYASHVLCAVAIGTAFIVGTEL